MLDRIIRSSLRHRWGVLAAAFVLLVAGGALTSQLPVDIFPDLTAPTVTVITEAKGLAPEELELLVTFPVESALNGASGVRRIRSVSGPGIAVVWVEFEWGEDVYLARQIVAERLQTVSLPTGVERPTLGPISSIMGEITFMALTSDRVSAMELRRLAETVVRRRRSRRRARSRPRASTSTGARSTWSAASAGRARRGTSRRRCSASVAGFPCGWARSRRSNWPPSPPGAPPPTVATPP